MDGAADRIGERGYEQLRRAAGTHRSDLVLRLGAEAGLRPAEMTAVRLTDITEFEGHRLLAVREDGEVVRETYLPVQLSTICGSTRTRPGRTTTSRCFPSPRVDSRCSSAR